jgi:hypothetical protein
MATICHIFMIRRVAVGIALRYRCRFSGGCHERRARLFACCDHASRLRQPIAIQEPDSTAWRCYPPSEAWDRLKAAILDAFQRGGGDFDAGRRTHMMLRDRGAEDVRMRAMVLALAPGHP